MRNIFAVLFLLLCSIAPIHGQKTRFGQAPPYAKPGVDYPIKVHISGMHIRTYCSSGEHVSCEDLVYADLIMSGKKIELRGDWEYSDYQLRLLPGDYDARIVKANHPTDDFPIYQNYEVILPDKRVFRGVVTGISE